MPTMIRDGKVWSADEMHLFYRLAHEYYVLRDDEPGYFLDLGANIGTTSIYFRKKVDTNVEIVAFEPDDSNNKLLQINLLLNGLAGEAYAESYGLSDRRENRQLYYDENNPGGTSLVKNSGGMTAEVPLISLDEYFEESGLDDARIKYIWIDTEGFELFVVGGAMNILKKRAIPLYMEFNPYLWNKQGHLQTMADCLREAGYTRYILIQEYMEGRKEIWPVDSLVAFKDAGPNFQRDIFLIKGNIYTVFFQTPWCDEDFLYRCFAQMERQHDIDLELARQAFSVASQRQRIFCANEASQKAIQELFHFWGKDRYLTMRSDMDWAGRLCQYERVSPAGRRLYILFTGQYEKIKQELLAAGWQEGQDFMDGRLLLPAECGGHLFRSPALIRNL